jgi:TPR repeat protein
MFGLFRKSNPYAFDVGCKEVRLGNFVLARGSFEDAGRQGDGRGWFALGQLASEGTGEASNPGKAAKLYRRGAEAGCGGAAHSLAALYALGKGVPKDPKAAIEWYRRGAELGDDESSFKVGLMLVRGETDATTAELLNEARERWKRLADKGHVAATLWLGHWHNGLGPDGSVLLAASYYLEIVERTDADPAARGEAMNACDSLSSLLVLNSQMGDHEASYHLGRWLKVTSKIEDARRSFAQAADGGHPGAMRAVADAHDDGRSIGLYEAAVLGGDLLAHVRLGARYAVGNGVPKDAERAATLLEFAAQRGNVEAMARAGVQLESLGRYEEARVWHVRAAERKHGGAMMAAANAYRDGRGGPRDLVQALRWYWSLLDVGDGDGIHHVHVLAPDMTNAELRTAARLSGDSLRAAAAIRFVGREDR